jgi:spermidine synthase
MLGVLAALFFLSGVSALIYQVLWLRMLALILGVTVYAASTVLASFMAGLAIGSAIAGRIADRVARPLAWFGAAELLIAATALNSPFGLDLIGSLYVKLAGGRTAPTSLAVARIVCSALVLLPPTVLMGATLPLVLRSSLARAPAIGARISLLYGVNTCGAIAGALLAGFVLIGSIGMTRTLQLAAAISASVGVAAIVLARRVSTSPSAAQPAEPVPREARSQRAVVVPIAFFLSGFTSLALEVVWFRALVLYFPATTYAFTAMLGTVLAGIAAGSLMVAPLLRRTVPTLRLFGALHGAIGIATLVGFRALAATYDGADRFPHLVAGAALTILPASILMGAAFPVGCRLWLESTEDSGRRVGVLYSTNLAGAILGSLAAGFVLLPGCGSARSIAVLSAISAATGLGVLVVAAPRAVSRVVPVMLLIAAIVGASIRNLPDPFTTGLMKRYREAGRIFMRDEGVQTTVSVHVRELGSRQLYLDGLHQASDGRDVVLLHRQIGHLPMLLHPHPARALVIGLGGGATAGAVSLHQGTDVDVVELAPGVVRAASWFTHVNEDVLNRPNVHVTIDDARNYLMLGRGRYDVITADIIQPTHAGAGILYSREYFTLARRALADGGLMVQWVGPRSDTHYRLIARTFQDVFPETTVWGGGSLLIGALRPQALDRAALADRIARSGLTDTLAAVGFGDADQLLAQYVAGRKELHRFLGPGPILTDDRPRLEYYLSLPANDRPVDLTRLREPTE